LSSRDRNGLSYACMSSASPPLWMPPGSYTELEIQD
jgi:hypothetical protein